MHVHVEQQRRLADVLHNGTVVLLRTYALVSTLSGRWDVTTVSRTAAKVAIQGYRTYNVEPVQKNIVSKKYVGLHQVFIVGVDASTNAAV